MSTVRLGVGVARGEVLFLIQGCKLSRGHGVRYDPQSTDNLSPLNVTLDKYTAGIRY